MTSLLVLGAPSGIFGQDVARMFYDDSNQLRSIFDSSGTLLEYVYDPVGNILEIKRSTVPPTALAIFNITPASGLPGSTFRIYGQNFAVTPGSNQVRLNGIQATVLSATSTELLVQIPSGNVSGQVSLTVSGQTVNSGTLLFRGLLPPTISGLLPDGGISGRSGNLTITGTDLDAATFSTVPTGGFTFTASSTDISANGLAVYGSPGIYTVVATNAAGQSPSAPAPTNQFRVLETTGETYFPLTVLNTAAPPPGTADPSLVSNEAAHQLLTVLNTAPPAPGTAEPSTVSNESATPLLTVLNTTPPPPGTAEPSTVSNELSTELLTILNTAPAPSGTPDPSLVSSEASGDWLTVLNTAPPPLGTPDPSLVSNEATGLTTTVLRTGPADAPPGLQPKPSDSALIRLTRSGEPQSEAAEVLPGETVRLRARPQPGETVEFLVNGVSFGNPSSDLVFEAPFGLKSLTVQAIARTPGQSRLLDTIRLQVGPPATTELRGRVLDESGAPVANLPIQLEAEALLAELFDFDAPLVGLPDLSNRSPSARRFVAALNQSNPEGVFGPDPLAFYAAPDYAVRYTAKLRIDQPGDYRFDVKSHAGARLSINGQPVNGPVRLTVGEHPFELIHFEATGAPSLQLLWQVPGGELSPLPARQFVVRDSSLAVTTDITGLYRVPSLPLTLGAIQATVGEGEAKLTSEQTYPQRKEVTEIENLRIRKLQRN